MKTLFQVDFRCLFPFPVTNDSTGNTLKEDIKDPQGTLTKTVSYQYDILGRLWRINNPDGNYSEYSYDAVGNKLSYKDPKGSPQTFYDYDPLGRLREITLPGDVHTLYDYNSHSNLTSITDGNGNATTYILDDMGRVYQEVSPDRGTTTYQYDPSGNMTSKTDDRGITVNYSHDVLNRRTLSDFPTDIDTVYTYDGCTSGKGRLCQVQDQAATTTYNYSPKGWLLQEDRLVLGVNYTTGYQYDDNGNVEVLTYPSGRTVIYSYDLSNKVTGVATTPAGGVQQTIVSNVTYRPSGGVSYELYANGLERVVESDLQSRITGIETGSIYDVTCTYDANSNIDLITDNLDQGNNTTLTHDFLDRLTAANGPWGDLSWTYDDLGNRLSYSDGTGAANYSYENGTNRIIQTSGSTTATFTYDGNGNTITEDARSYTYDESNRLTSVVDGVTVLADFSYSASGQRVSKTVNGESVIFHYNQYGQIISETDSFGTTIAEYIYMKGQPLAKVSGSDVFYIHTDHLAKPVAMTDSNGAIAWEIVSRPFGDEASTSGSADLNLRFRGQYYDVETGLNYNYFRDYDPRLGRYVQVDPIGLSAGLNPFRFVSNNPYKFIDPFGLCDDPERDCYPVDRHACCECVCWTCTKSSPGCGAGDDTNCRPKYKRDDGCVWPPPYGPPDGPTPGPGPEIGGEHPGEDFERIEPEGTDPKYAPNMPPEYHQICFGMAPPIRDDTPESFPLPK